MNLKPVVFMNGDDSTRRGATMVKEIVFPDFPFVDCDTGVDARLKTNDECITAAATLLAQHRAGIKISTASNDPRIKAKGWKSANIALRPLVKVIGMFRLTMAPGGYKRPVGVMRFGSGDFYTEKECTPTTLAGGMGGVRIVQEYNTDFLEPFANAAADRAKRYGLQMIIAAKWTISAGERLLPDACDRVFQGRGLSRSEVRGKGDYYWELSDIAAANIPRNVAVVSGCPMDMDNGGWLIVTGNANGDTFADIADFQHGGNSMGSECITFDGFSYQELPGGTAPGRRDSNFKGDKFFSPTGTLVAFCGAIAGLNPEVQPYADAVLAAAATYMGNTAEQDRCTETMLRYVASEAKAKLPS